MKLILFCLLAILLSSCQSQQNDKQTPPSNPTSSTIAPQKQLPKPLPVPEPITPSFSSSQTTVSSSSSTVITMNPVEDSQSSQPPKIAPKLEPGPYCFTSKDSSQSSKLELLIAADQTLTGKLETTDNYAKTNNKNDLAIISRFAGVVKDNNKLEVSIIEQQSNQQPGKQSQEVWQMEVESLQTKGLKFAKVNCAMFINSDNYSHKNQESSQTSEATTQDQPIRVEFAANTNSQILENSLIRGTRAIYVVNARQNQTMTLKVTSVEDNAVFDLISPDGNYLETELKDFSLTLPKDGDYQVIVGSTRGNTTYKLMLQID